MTEERESNGLLDDGSDGCFVRLGLAKELGLLGKRETVHLQTAGNDPVKKQMLRFNVPVIKDLTGETVMVSCLGLNLITNNSSEG